MDIAGQLVEVVAYIIEQLPHSPKLVLLLANDRSNTFSRSMLAPAEVARCRAILQHTHIDWGALGYDDRTTDELVEFLLRIIPVNGHRAARTASLGCSTAHLLAEADRTGCHRNPQRDRKQRAS